MNIHSRLNKLEQITPNNKKLAWDFSKLSREQLDKLHDLAETGNAESYVKELVESGLLSYPQAKRGNK